MSWKVTGATSVSISDIGPVGLVGSKTYIFKQTSKYVLTATAPGLASVEKAATIYVTPAPPMRLTRFDISSNKVTLGETVTLLWSVQNVASVEITPEPGRVEAEGSRTLQPKQTTEYTLRGTDAAGRTVVLGTRQVSVSIPAPTVNSFSFTPRVITQGQSSRLEWDVSAASEVKVGESVLSAAVVAPRDSLTRRFSVAGTFAWYLVVRGLDGKVNAYSANIEVRPEVRSVPRTNSFVWSGNIRGSEMVHIINGVPKVGRILRGSLPGIPCKLEPVQSTVRILAVDAYCNDVEMLVKGSGRTTVEVRWIEK